MTPALQHSILAAFLCALGVLCGSAFAAEPAVTVRITGGRVVATDAHGAKLADKASGADDAAVIQAVIDASGRGRKITLGTGRYILKHPLVLDRAVIFEGEGRETVLVPPPDDYAIRIIKTQNSPVRSELEGPEAPELVLRLEGHLYPVLVRDLCIDGEGRGRGLYLERVFNATAQSLFITRTGAGAGLCVGPFAMECVFDNVVLHSCGNAGKKEASVVIAAQEEGDPGNNTRFRALEVIFSRWNSVHIGAGAGRRTPRLIFFQQCFFHGKLPFEELPPCDLIHVERCEGNRGVVNFTDCRLTNAHEDHSLLRVTEARVNVTACVLGGGHGRSAIRIEDKANVVVRGCAFQDNALMGREFAVEATGGRLIFSGNTIDAEREHRIALTSVRDAIITDNQFTLTGDNPTIRLAAEASGKPCGPVVIANNAFAETRAKCAIEHPPAPPGTLVIENNVFRGAYQQKAIVQP